MVNFIAEEHVERDVVVYFVSIEVDVAGIINGADNILYAVGNRVCACRRNRRVGLLVEGYVLVFLVAAFIYFADELIGLQGSGIKKRLVAVAHFKNPIVAWVTGTCTYHMIYRFIVQLLEGGGEGGGSGICVQACHRIENGIGYYFAGFKGMVPHTAEIVAGRKPHTG